MQFKRSGGSLAYIEDGFVLTLCLNVLSQTHLLNKTHFLGIFLASARGQLSQSVSAYIAIVDDFEILQWSNILPLGLALSVKTAYFVSTL